MKVGKVGCAEIYPQRWEPGARSQWRFQFPLGKTGGAGGKNSKLGTWDLRKSFTFLAGIREPSISQMGPRTSC